MPIEIVRTDAPLADSRVTALLETLRAAELTSGSAASVRAAVEEILADIRSRGDAALVDWERKLDAAELTPETLRVPAERIEQAHREADGAFLALIRRAAENIRRYQEWIKVEPPDPLRRGGRTLGLRYTPVERVGVYVPGMRALYPSTVLMTVIPAQVAGVGRLALTSPPRADGDVAPLVLALAGELGVEEVYRLGGAVAVGAFAFGTDSVPRVDQVAGPGNAYVAEAKRQVYGRVGIDSIAGPSEVLVIADDTADAAWVAADLLAQAEHDPGSAVLVTTSSELAEAVSGEIDRQLETLERADAARAGLARYSRAFVVPDLDAACDLANAFAAEHLQIITSDDEAALARVHNAGAIFVGGHTPVPVGDYYAGPSHVLPTGTTARFFGPLSCNDFLKPSSVVRYDAEALAEDAEDVADFARREGLTAHAAAVERRLRGTEG